MNYLLIMLLAGISLLGRPAAPTVYHLLPAASTLTWTGHAEVGAYAPSGTLQLRSGRFEYDGTTLRRAEMVIDMTTLHHDNGQLQAHLRGEDFFDVARFPTAEFRLTKARPGEVTGQLTLKGQTLPVTFPVSLQPQPDGSMRVQGTATIDRTRFGIRYNSTAFFASLGDQAIRNDFQVSFSVLAQPAR